MIVNIHIQWHTNIVYYSLVFTGENASKSHGRFSANFTVVAVFVFFFFFCDAWIIWLSVNVANIFFLYADLRIRYCNAQFIRSLWNTMKWRPFKWIYTHEYHAHVCFTFWIVCIDFAIYKKMNLILYSCIQCVGKIN